VDGNPATATTGSIPPAAAIENPQREIVNAIIAAGLTPNNSNLSQLLAAIELLGRIPYCQDVGSINHIIISPVPAGTAYAVPMILAVKVLYANAGATDINVSGLGTVPLITPAQGPLAASTLSAGGIVLVSFDGVNFQLLTAPAASGGGSPALTDLWHYGTDVSVVPNFVNVTTDNVGSAWAAGLPVAVYIANTNTTASNIELNGFANVNITRGNGVALLAGDLVAGTIAVMVFDGTQAQLLNPHLSAASVFSGTDTGTANAVSVTALNPVLTVVLTGMIFDVTKIASANSSTATATIMGTSGAVRWADGTALASGDWPASTNALLQYDGTHYNLLSVMGPTVFARQSQITTPLVHYGTDTSGAANTILATVTPEIIAYAVGHLFYLKVANLNTGPTTININSIGAVAVIMNLTGAALVGGEINVQGGTESIFYYDGTAMRLLNSSVGLWKILEVTTTGTYTPSANCTRVRVRAWGAGGGGANATYGLSGAAFGAGGGAEYREGIFSVTPSVGISCTVQGTQTAAQTTGADTVFGSLMTAKGGLAGSGLTSGGASPTGTGGQLVFAGQAGQRGFVSYDHDCFLGWGGASFGFSGFNPQIGNGGLSGNPGAYLGGSGPTGGGLAGVGLILIEELAS
jgi:hypothetical protein